MPMGSTGTGWSSGSGRGTGCLIVRLPALYGLHMKKNFIYDFLHVIPSMLKGDTFEELAAQAPLLREYYQPQENGFYKCQALAPQEEQLLKETFQGLGFTALNFTDSRNAYQFYPLSRLWEDLQTRSGSCYPPVHPATEPVSAGEVYRYLTGEEFVNHIAPQPIYYNYKTKYADVFGGRDGYLMGKDAVLSDIKVCGRGQSMKLSISNIGWDAKQDEAVYRLMGAYGFSGLELPPHAFFQRRRTPNGRRRNAGART